MFDKAQLKTTGMITVAVQHPPTKRTFNLDFYVAKKHEQPLLGFTACRTMDLLRVVEENICAVGTAADNGPPNAAKTNRSAACVTEAEIRAEYADLFEGVGLLEGEVHLVIDQTVPPVQMPLRRLPIGVRDKVAAELQRLEANGIIAPVAEPTPWVSALLVVAKPDGRIRLVIDPKHLNVGLQRAKYCLPTITDILPRLAGAKVFSSVDARDGFFHLMLDEESSRLTTFETPFGRWRWLRMPNGIKPAPEIFQARMHAALSGLKGVECIADDILIAGAGATEEEAMEDHNRNLRALLDRCRERGIKLNADKLKLNRQSIIFCGHELTRSGVRPDPRKIEAILNLPAPTERSGVLRLIGMATYLAKFCENFSSVTAPIRALLLKDSEFVWRPEVHGVAFDNLKALLVNAPVLAYFDASKPLTVQGDASSGGLGCVLLQDNRPVEYASRAMSPTEMNYAQIEKELLAVVFAMERFHTYCYAYPHQITVETDHKPLVSINRKSLSLAPKRLQRMLLRLQRYSFELVYRPGSTLVLADTLSRAYPPLSADTDKQTFSEELAVIDDEEQLRGLQMVASERTINAIRAAAADDSDYILLKEQIAAGWPTSPSQLPPELKPYATFCEQLVVSGGLVYKGNTVVIPRGAREDILNRLHSSHIGVNGCIRRAREAVYFSGITAAIKQMVSRCDVCSRFKSEAQKEPLMSHPAPSAVWTKVATDIMTLNSQDYLVTVCYLSGYFEVDRLPSKKITDVIYVQSQATAD